jgi:hypothetical protein
MTPEQIAEKYLNATRTGGAVEIDESETVQEGDDAETVAARYLKGVTAKPEPKVEEPEAPTEPGFLERSRDTLQLGLSDAMSTIAGDTYGRFGEDPTTRTPLDPASRVQTAIGGDALPAVGSVLVDAVASAAKEYTPDIVKEGLSGALEWMQKNKESHPIYSDASYLEGASQLTEALPEEMQTRLGEIANISAITSVPKLATLSSGADEALIKSMDRLRKKDIRRRLEPRNIEDDANFGTVREVGIRNKKVYDPTDAEKRMDAEVFEIEGLDPRRSARHMTTQIEDRVEELRVGLDDSLVGQSPIVMDDVTAGIDEAIERASRSPTMVGDAEQSAQKIYVELQRLLAEAADEAGNIAPGDLLKVRRDLDKWLRNSTSNVFDSSIIGANQIATREIRQSINDIINRAAPDQKVAESLQRQSDLLRGRDNLDFERKREARSGLGRAVTKVEEDTGLGPAKTPLAMISNISSWPAMLLTGAMTVGSLGTRGAVKAGLRLKAGAMRNIESAVNAGNEAAILAILNADESYEE